MHLCVDGASSLTGMASRTSSGFYRSLLVAKERTVMNLQQRLCDLLTGYIGSTQDAPRREPVSA